MYSRILGDVNWIFLQNSSNLNVIATKMATWRFRRNQGVLTSSLGLEIFVPESIYSYIYWVSSRIVSEAFGCKWQKCNSNKFKHKKVIHIMKKVLLMAELRGLKISSGLCLSPPASFFWAGFTHRKTPFAPYQLAISAYYSQPKGKTNPPSDLREDSGWLCLDHMSPLKQGSKASWWTEPHGQGEGVPQRKGCCKNKCWTSTQQFKVWSSKSLFSLPGHDGNKTIILMTSKVTTVIQYSLLYYREIISTGSIVCEPRCQEFHRHWLI